MKLGIRPFIYGYAGDRCYEKMKEHGYSCAHFDMVSPDGPFYLCAEAELERLIQKEKALADGAGIRITQVHGPIRIPPRDLDPADRAEWMDKMIRAVKATALLGCQYLVVHPLMPYGNEDLKEGREEETHAINLAFMRELVTAAKPYGVTVCLENMPYRDFSLGTPKAVFSFVGQVGDPHFKMCLDTGHANVQPDSDPVACVRAYGSEIRVLHIHDNNGIMDLHGFPYNGNINWHDFCNALKEVGFAGDFSLEANMPWEMPQPFYDELCCLIARSVQQLLDDHQL